jgi:tRNA(Arg) A34 adenosine deaminase TadA
MDLPTLSRREAVLGALCSFGCTRAPHGKKVSRRLKCSDVAAPPPLTLTPTEEEMHCILLLLAMALVFDGWGVDRRRPEQIAAYAAVEPARRFADYLGHNVGALLVDRNSDIICFALNRSVELNSTLEHAELRTVRAAIQIANASRVPSDPPSWSFGSLLQADRLYATLEPCSQCAGILELARFGSVTYAQDDPAQHHIANVLYNLHQQPGAPLPVRALFLPFWDELTTAYQRFVAAAPQGGRTGLTSFLQTVEAYQIYRKAATAFATMQEKHPANAGLLHNARMFRTRWQESVQKGVVPA